MQDDVRRLTQMPSIYLSQGFIGTDQSVPRHLFLPPYSFWLKGRLQQANDGNWIFRSISLDGTVVGFQLGPVNSAWNSSETPNAGLIVQFMLQIPATPTNLNYGSVFLQQQLPQELT